MEKEFSIFLPFYEEPSENLKAFIERYPKNKLLHALLIPSGIVFTTSNLEPKYELKNRITIPINSLKSPDSVELDLNRLTILTSSFNMLYALSHSSDSVFEMHFVEDTDKYPLSKKILKASLRTSNATLQSSIGNILLLLD